MKQKIRNNLYYFKISQENHEPHLDINYFVLEKHPDLPIYIANVKEIKEILITIRKLKETGENKDVVEKYFRKLFAVFNKKSANCSELGCFVNACDTTRDLIQKDYETFKNITEIFLEKRDFDENEPESWIQAIIDNNSSRKKGELGERKLIKILEKLKIGEVKNWEEFMKRKFCVARFGKEDFSIKNIRRILGIKIPLKKQDKNLDLIIKVKDRIFILEAKHLNVGGGEQDKQISELIEILRLKKEKDNIFYISFLDGTYSNILLGNISKRSKKKRKQRQEIEKYLRYNHNNFWLNTSGFKNLFDNLVK